jgi:hypothetical protein
MNPLTLDVIRAEHHARLAQADRSARRRGVLRPPRHAWYRKRSRP